MSDVVGAQSIPTLVVLDRGGRVLDRQVGALPAAVLVRWAESAAARAAA